MSADQVRYRVVIPAIANVCGVGVVYRRSLLPGNAPSADVARWLADGWIEPVEVPTSEASE